MEHYKTSKLLNDSTVSKFVTKKWVELKDLSSGQYSVGKNIRFKRSDWYDYSDAYIVVKGTIIVTSTNNDKRTNKKLVFKNNALFWSCISKINNTFIDNAEDLYIVMPMYNLLEYSDNYSTISRSLWNYYTDEVSYDESENDAHVNMVNNNKITTSKSLEYKTKMTGSTPNNGNKLNAEVVVSLKYLSNFWKSLDLPLINCEIEFDLSCSNFV